ncbi:hypothetical protein J3A64_001829 [Pseudarthrobacter sp. PvP004]|uniref:hypothetical protein n=1 Tax=Pseudarthrobacter sp. PvP004 TaxID=2817850 RepID=UPI001AE28275|nr:hypothetical protein [Pseudarthrobacter sp. PvP004]MBP2266365.1 hypothetical protein [Pseudarthrobacter sp. PvP004]
MKPLARKPQGIMAFIENNDDAKINAYFGSRSEWESIGDWSTFWPHGPTGNPISWQPRMKPHDDSNAARMNETQKASLTKCIRVPMDRFPLGSTHA